MYFIFVSRKLSKLRVFSEARFLYLDERIKQTWYSLITQTGRAMKKIVFEARRSMNETGRFYMKLFMSMLGPTAVTRSRAATHQH